MAMAVADPRQCGWRAQPLGRFASVRRQDLKNSPENLRMPPHDLLLTCWSSLKKELGKLSPALRQSLEPGADTLELQRWEDDFGATLPPALRALYGQNAGQRSHCPETRRTAFLFFHRDNFRLLSPREALIEHRDLPTAPRSTFPVAAAATGDFLCLDQDSGAVVLGVHDRQGVERVSDSLAELVCQHARDLRECYLVESAPGILEPPDPPREELDRVLADLAKTSPEMGEEDLLQAVSERLLLRPRWLRWRCGKRLLRRWKRLRSASGGLLLACLVLSSSLAGDLFAAGQEHGSVVACGTAPEESRDGYPNLAR